ncbi:MAG: UDP-N-acetylmuramoyl-tripeptide--D-alanyl-D-alanine ligase [Bacteriovoracia bacterium]
MHNESKSGLEPRLSSEFVSQSINIDAQQNDSERLSFIRVVTDSRIATKGDLFVAIKGEHLDGHDYIDAALSAGVSGVLAERTKTESGAKFYIVKNSIESFRCLAKKWRAQFSIPVICVAGSTGKTTTKELMAAVFSGKYKNVLKTEKSQNGFIGIPMTLLNLRAASNAAIIEVGIDAPGAMVQHLEVVKPTASILTTIGPEHLEQLKNLETVIKEESLAISMVQNSGGIVCVNLEDPNISKLYSNKDNVWSYAWGEKSDVKPRRIVGKLREADLVVNSDGFLEERFHLPLPGKHNALNLLAAITMAIAHGLTANEIRQGLATFKSADGRSEVHKKNGVHFLCDYYNANPTSMGAAFSLLLDTYKKQNSKGSRFVCLGDMLELGSLEEKSHRELANQIEYQKVEHVYLYGQRMKFLEDELRKISFRGELIHFSNHQKLAETLRRNMKTGDLVLIKGSRSMKMEKVWQEIEKN